MAENNAGWKRPLLIGAIVVTLVTVLYGATLSWLVTKPADLSALGDMFGGLNTLFAGLALAGVIYTIYLQVQDAAESRKNVQNQIALLREEVELQRKRDRVHAGPFFRLISNSYSHPRLDFRVENVGASIVCLDLQSTTPGCKLVAWYPSTLATGETLTAPLDLDTPNSGPCTLRMKFRDRYGDLRSLDMQIDHRPSPARLDFVEV